jgi:hypothetical protein
MIRDVKATTKVKENKPSEDEDSMGLGALEAFVPVSSTWVTEGICVCELSLREVGITEVVGDTKSFHSSSGESNVEDGVWLL